jgi:adenylate cyclase
LSNLLREDYMRETPSWITYLLAGIFAIVMAGVFFKIGNVIPATIITLLAAAAFMLIAYVLFYYWRVWTPIGGPELGLLFGFTFSGAVSYVTEGRRRRELRRVLNRYLSPRVVDEILLNPDDFELGGREMDATVFFSDIKNFTGLSEKLTPKELVTSLNEYFTLASDIVLSHDAMLDKYIGDAIMATFGTPRTGVRDATNALACGRAMLDTVAAWNRERARRGEVAIKVGIGLHFGPAVMGDIGDERRLEYAVIGDTVNVASRLEALTREVAAPMVVSDDTVAAVRRESGESAILAGLQRGAQAAVRGRAGTVPVWTLGVAPAGAA